MIKTVIKVMPLIAIGLMVTACSNEDKKATESKELAKVEVVRSDVTEENITITNKKSEAIEALKLKIKDQQQKSVQIRKFTVNNEKFTTTTWPLTKGSKVINLNTNATGKVTGNIVIVLNEKLQLPSTISQNFSYVRLTKNTYKLTPKPTSTKKLNQIDLIEQYQKLMKQDFLVVEMEVYYSGLKERELI